MIAMHDDSTEQAETFSRVPSVLSKHYEKVIVFCCFLLVFMSVGLPGAAFSVYQSYLVELPGLGNVGGSTVLLVRTFVSFVSMLATAAYYERFDCRKGATMACLFNMLGFALFGFAQTLPMFCLAAVFTGLAYGLGGTVASTILIGRWFEGNLGSALGIVALGSGVAGFVMPPCLAAIVQASSLSMAFFSECALIGVLTLFVVLFVRNNPQDLGLQPFKGSSPKGKKKQREAKSGKPLQQESLPRKVDALMIIAIICLGCAAAGGSGYIGVLMTSEGFSPLMAALFVSVMGGCLSLGKILNGIVFDLVGTRRGTALFFSIAAVGGILCASLFFVKSAPLAFLGVSCYGLGGAIASVGIPMWSLELSHVEQRARTIKNFQSAYAFGGFLFNFIPGYLADVTGTYASSYAILTVLLVVSAVLVLAVYRRYLPAT